MDDSTDLTTLTGEADQFLALVEKKFKSDDEAGNLTWGILRCSTYTQLLDDFADNGREKAFLRAWVQHYQLEDGFKIERDTQQQQQQQRGQLQEELRALKKLIVEQKANESRAVSYAEYYEEKMKEGRIETWLPTPSQPSDSTRLPPYLLEASSNIGSEKQVVKPFWEDLLGNHRLLPTWNNGYEIAHLGTKIPDISVFPEGVAKPSARDFVAAGDCKGSTWTGTSRAEMGQIMLYVHRMLDAQPTREFGYGFVTNNRIVVLVKGYRSTDSPYIVRWSLSNALTFEHGMKAWLQLMQEDTGYHQPPTVNGYLMSFDETLRPGGTCRAFGATYRGASVVAKLYADATTATDNASRTRRAADIVSDAARSRPVTLAQVPNVVATEGSWSLIEPKGSRLSRETITRIHVDRLVHTLKVVHIAGIIHRDVRVSNIFVLSDDQVLLNDWGSSVRANESVLYAGAPQPHIHPEIPLLDFYQPSARHDLYSLVSSLAQLLLPGANKESRSSFFEEAFHAAETCNYESLCEGIKRHMR